MTDRFEQLADVVRRRRSIREFNDQPVDIGQVRKIIDVATHAPSSNNRQGWRFHVVSDAETKSELARRIGRKIEQSQEKSRVIDDLMAAYKANFIHFETAPVVIVCCFVKPNRFALKAFDIDDENRHMTGELISLSLVIQNLLLLSEAAGLGTLVMTSPLIIAHDIRQILNIPNKFTIGAFVCMGHYDSVPPPPPPHRPIDQILHIHSQATANESQTR